MIDLIVILADIRSTHNVGSILRSSDCFGVSQVFFAGITPYPRSANDNRLPHLIEKLTKDIHKTALGAEDFVHFCVFSNTEQAINKARSLGYEIACLEQSSKSTPLSSYSPPNKLAIILGNEVTGIPRQTLMSCDVILEIPMLGKKESLNVSVASAIAIYDLKLRSSQ